MRVAGLAILLLCATPAFADAVEEVRTVETAFAKAFVDRDAAKFFSYVADDATFLSPRQTLSGKPEIVKRWSGFFTDKVAPFSWRPERVVVNAAGTVGLSTGPVVDKDGNQAGIYSSIWEKNAAGEWKVIFDGPGAPSPVDEGYIQTPDGVKLHYRKTGRGAPAIIVPLDHLMWDSFSTLADRGTVITYDPRSRGRSTRTESISVENDLKDLETVRNHFNIDRVIPVGYSYLGLVVAMYTRDHPEHVVRLIQIAPAAMTPAERDAEPPPAPSAPSAEFRRRDSMLSAGEIDTRPREFCEADFKVFRHFLVGDPAKIDRVESPCEYENEQPKYLWHTLKLLNGTLQKVSVTPRDLKAATMPVLIVHGTKDRNAPYLGGRTWSKSFPYARLITVDGAAHAVLWEENERVMTAIRTFVGGGWPAEAEIIK
jgi:pimeloyl-ACP methyl ester carboxylesterase/ketosteroid isomerase-like protein